MLTKEYEKGKLFFMIGNERWEPLASLGDYSIEMIQTSDLKQYAPHSFIGSGRLEVSFDMDRQVAQKLHAELQPKHGEKLAVETSCVCDSTLVFAVQLMQALKRIGATNIKIRSEEVENPNPAWMKTRFIATGIIWNTNNFRRLHGVPMKRRKR